MNTISTSRRRPKSNRYGRSRLRSFVTALQIMILLGIGASVGVALGLFVNLSQALPTVGNFDAPEATIIYSSDGIILGRIFREDRTNVPLKDVPIYLRDATVAIEDHRFYHHSGVDLRGIARAVWANLRGQRLTQGGSTITQQLARNVYLSQQKTIQRKVQEAVLAILIERNFSKDRILEMYLNRVYYGSGAFGVQAAAKVYFGKDVSRLNLSEAALVAGLPQRPTGYSPHENLQEALDRRDTVLNSMAEYGYITPTERDAAKAQKITIIPKKRGRKDYKAPNFVDYVAQQLRDVYGYGDDVLYGGGLRVYTTLNYKMQEIAEDALREGVKRVSKINRVSEGCFICIEPSSGYIRAMVGSVDPVSEFNRCTQGPGRQPGSSFKAFVYTAALETGMKPTDRIVDGPVSYPGGNGKVWSPKNYDDRWHGTVTMARAVAMSINIPAIKTAKKIGVNKVIDCARRLGITAELEPYLPIAIGGIKGVHPIEMASAYGTFANNGIHVEPCAITKITNSHGDTVQDFTPEGRQVISPEVNKMMDEMLRGVVIAPRGTGKSVRDVPEARGKTGTTNDDRDAWWLGYVPNKLVAACWIGNDNNTPMREAWGGTICAPIWKKFMLKAVPILNEIHSKNDKMVRVEKVTSNAHVKHNDNHVSDKPDQDAQPADNTDANNADNNDVVTCTICDESQLLATSNCPSTHAEQYPRGAEPNSYCTIHEKSTSANASNSPHKLAADSTPVTVTVCSESGMLAGPNCPNPVRKRFIIDDVPTQVCTTHSRSGNR